MTTSFTPQRILAIKLADLGDVLNITPALRALRHTFPQAQIDVLLNPHTAVLLRGSPLIDNIVIFPKVSYEGKAVLSPLKWPGLYRYLRDIRRRGYDTVIDFHHLTTPMGRLKQWMLIEATGARIRVGLDNGHGRWFSHPVRDDGFGAMPEVAYWLALARRLGAEDADTHLQVVVSAEARQVIQTMLQEAGLEKKRFIVLHPGSGGFSLARRWEPWKFAELAAALWQRYQLASIIVGGPHDDVAAVLDAASSPLIDWSERTTIPQLAALMEQSTLFVGADSGVMHLAAAMKTPLVAIFGPSNHRAWAPWTPSSPSEVVRLDLPCSPCAYVNHSLGRRHGCPERTCLADLGVEPVLAAVQRLLAPRAQDAVDPG